MCFRLITLLFFLKLAAAVNWRPVTWAGGATFFFGLFQGVNRSTISRCPDGFYRTVQQLEQQDHLEFEWECVGWWTARAAIGGATAVCSAATASGVTGWFTPDHLPSAVHQSVRKIHFWLLKHITTQLLLEILLLTICLLLIFESVEIRNGFFIHIITTLFIIILTAAINRLLN